MTTSRERFLQTCAFQHAAKPWFRAYAFVWPETELVWRTQGYAGPELGWHGAGLPQRFGLDELLRVDPWYGPVPEFAHTVIEEDELTRLYINHEGILMREFKEHADTSMPQFVKFPVETPEEFEAFAAERLALNAKHRLNETWQRQVAAGQLHAVAGMPTPPPSAGTRLLSLPLPATSTRACAGPTVGAGSLAPCATCSAWRICAWPSMTSRSWSKRMMEERADRIIEITAEVLKHTTFDVFWYWEDMAYKAGPLVGPDDVSEVRRETLPPCQRLAAQPGHPVYRPG